MKLNSRIERGSTKEFLAKSLSISRVPRLRSSSSCVLNHTYCIEYCCLRRGLVTGDFPIRRRPSFFSFLFFRHHLPSAPHHSSLFYGLAGNRLGLSHSLSLLRFSFWYNYVRSFTSTSSSLPLAGRTGMAPAAAAAKGQRQG